MIERFFPKRKRFLRTCGQPLRNLLNQRIEVESTYLIHQTPLVFQMRRDGFIGIKIFLCASQTDIFRQEQRNPRIRRKRNAAEPDNKISP